MLSFVISIRLLSDTRLQVLRDVGGSQRRADAELLQCNIVLRCLATILALYSQCRNSCHSFGDCVHPSPVGDGGHLSQIHQIQQLATTTSQLAPPSSRLNRCSSTLCIAFFAFQTLCNSHVDTAVRDSSSRAHLGARQHPTYNPVPTHTRITNSACASMVPGAQQSFRIEHSTGKT